VHTDLGDAFLLTDLLSLIRVDAGPALRSLILQFQPEPPSRPHPQHPEHPSAARPGPVFRRAGPRKVVSHAGRAASGSRPAGPGPPAARGATCSARSGVTPIARASSCTCDSLHAPLSLSLFLTDMHVRIHCTRLHQ
jgi:hypothetical protein